MDVAERIRQRVEGNQLEINGKPSLQMTVSIGVAMNSSESLERIMSHADLAMYEAKNSGRNRVVLSTKEKVMGDLSDNFGSHT